MVATPGRLLDCARRGHLDLSLVKYLIVDEADRMLDMGFMPQLKDIEQYIPKERETAMFSATFPDQI